MDYVTPEHAAELPGLRLVLTTGVPGPWGEAAKGIFAIKGIEYVPVAQTAGQPNDALRAWTGHRNAPTAVYADETPRIRWFEILALAERLEPEPPLTPRREDERLEMVGICHELCAEDGFGWNRRIDLVAAGLARADATDAQRAAGRAFGAMYGYRDEIVERAVERQVEILSWLGRRIVAQGERGSPYLVGDVLTAADIYWACFAALVQPLPEEVCPMPQGMRRNYGNVNPKVLERVDIGPLLAHRDFMYANHLRLPLDF